MNAPTVHNIRTEPLNDGLYCGRANPQKRLEQSKWGNPFVMESENSRIWTIYRYRAWVVRQPLLMKAVHELRGQRLFCWCHPKPCHLDFLAALAASTSRHGERCKRCQKGALMSTPFLRADPTQIAVHFHCNVCSWFEFEQNPAWVYEPENAEDKSVLKQPQGMPGELFAI
jgi:hypothetical protein